MLLKTALTPEYIARILGLKLRAQAVLEGAPSSNGTVHASELDKIGRNDPCWCGSGKKFKKCHGA